MSGQYVTTSQEGRIATVRFDRGDKANALSFAAIDELTEAALALDADPGLSAVILTGQPALFTLGFDLKDPQTEALPKLGLGEQRQRLRAGRRLCAAWTALEPMTIAAIEGWCVGGGVALAVACDFRVVGEGATRWPKGSAPWTATSSRFSNAARISTRRCERFSKNAKRVSPVGETFLYRPEKISGRSSLKRRAEARARRLREQEKTNPQDHRT
ncbi:MAG: enoyl-CoA hydratase/isomerase family protein [Alphaproteobacteria bacterium]